MEIKIESDREWRAWLASFVVLPFVPALSGVVILGLTGCVCWRSRRHLWGDRDLRLLWIWIGLLIAGIFSAVDPYEASLGAFNFVPFVVIFAAMSRVLTTVDRLRQLAWAIVLPAIGVCAIGLGELFWGWNVPGFPGLIDWQLVAGGTPPGRMSSVFLHANSLADYAAIVFALTLGLWCDLSMHQPPTSLDPPSRFSPVSQRLLLSVTIAANLTMLALTSSRNGWGVACLTLLAFLIYRHWWAIIAAIQAGIAIVLAAAFAPESIAQPFRSIVPYAIWGRLSDRMYPDRPIGSLRTTQWQYAIELIRDRPLGGWGLQSFSPLYEAHSQFYVGHPHNLYLMLAAETGTIATLLLMVVVGGIVTRTAISLICGHGQPEARSIVFAYAIAFLASSSYHLLDVPLFQIQVNLLGWTLLAGLVGVGSRSADQTQYTERVTSG
ncbi:MAG: O-antigen ligase family protein [Coleofasciculaceae cyanobacterium RL_1_1]|nr:O-antigen ligase family protein [Coleofasciculaceae cyanobacterium RL_1_1]